MLLLCLLLFALLLAGCGPFNEGGSQSNGSARLQVQQVPRARLTYVAIGASDTFGIGADSPRSQNWASDLSEQLGPDIHLVNLGVPGVLLHQALSIELPVALDSKPDLITIWLGVNDLASDVPPQQYAHDLDLLIKRLRAGAPHSRIAIANIPDVTLIPYFESSNPLKLHARIQAYNQAIYSIVGRHHLILVDLFQQWNDLQDHPEYISNDGLHPSTAGYERIASLFYQQLRKHPA